MERLDTPRVTLAASEAGRDKMIVAAMADRLGNMLVAVGPDSEGGLITQNTTLFFGTCREPFLTRLDTTYGEYASMNAPSPYEERQLFPDRSGTTILRANTTDGPTAHFVQYVEHGIVVGYAWRPNRNTPGTIEQLFMAHDLLGWDGATLTLAADGNTLRVALKYNFN